MILGSIYGHESIYLEFKEFCLQINTNQFYNDTDIYDIIHTGKLNTKYNSLVYQSLQYYFFNIFPKYLTSFFNANINGKIILGINDLGEITGIPLLNSIDFNIIETFLHQTIHSLTSNPHLLMSCIDLQIIPLEINPTLLNSKHLKHLLSIYHNKQDLLLTKLDKYYKQKNLWFSKVSIYEKKIIDLVNQEPSKTHLYQFISNFCIDEEIKLKLCTLLLSNDYIDIYLYNRTDETNIFYWACLFKDDVLSTLLKFRPIKPNIPIRIHPNLIFSRTTPLRQKFIQNNPNIKYFLIQISINTHSSHEKIYFQRPFCDKSYYKIRKLNSNNQPFCSSF